MIKKILLIIIPTTILAICLFLAIKAYQAYSLDYCIAYVASHQISQRTRIKDEDIIEVLVPKEYLSEDVFTSKDDILNKYVKLSYSLAKGSLFYKGALESDIKDLANTLLMNGQVNYDIYVNEVKINTGNLACNMYVDLYLTIDTNDKPLSDLLISNARITGMYDPNGKALRDYDNDSRVYIVSLAIDKKDVNVINKAMLVGEIKAIANSNTYDTMLYTIQNKSSAIYSYLE